jgi:hypothetical protein
MRRPRQATTTSSDPIVLGADVAADDIPAILAGTSDLFVTRFVEAAGHCKFTAGQIGSAFDALRAWARDGKRPAAGTETGRSRETRLLCVICWHDRHMERTRQRK